MNTSYLVQRCNFKEYVESNTVTEAYRPEYMGSAEFEFGALPASLRAMAKDVEQYVGDVVTINDISVYIWCKKDEVDEVKSNIELMAKEKYGILKEVNHFSDYFNGASLKEKERIEKKMQKKVKGYEVKWENFWWDICNNFVWSFDYIAISSWKFALCNSIKTMALKNVLNNPDDLQFHDILRIMQTYLKTADGYHAK